MRPRLLLLTAVLALLPGIANAWWNDAWAFRKKVTLNTSPSGVDAKQPVAELPVLVRLHTGNFTFADANEDGSDLRFVASDEKTPLRYHVEQWDAVNELATVWVRVPSIAPGSTTDHVWLYFGNKAAKAEDDPKQRYDTAQTLVLHFSAADGVPVDASAYAHALVATGVVPLPQGPIGKAASFNGSSSVRVAAAPTLAAGAQGMTLSAWIRMPGPQAQAQLVAQQDVVLGVAGVKPVLRIGAVQVTGSADITPNAWHHIAAVVGGGKAVLYQDGNAVGEAAAQLSAVAGELTVGAGLQGDLDEVQVSNVARSTDWVHASWAGQGPEARLVSFGQDEETSGGSTSYVRILLSAVTLDGWVVIGILMVMMVISVFVMFAKTMFVLRTDKANRLFMDVFEKDPDGMLEPARADKAPQTLAGSSLFRLYRIGIRELKLRLDRHREGGNELILSPQALGAIKSSLDAGMIRESARLNSQMVLLTIAISGGPFLGLLGTVVGVMITFAAIAAAGDVNVNSIAPGIAAALVATVAGLAVAIPALFGYNYLASRIKNLSNDMMVFADELMNRMAEKYS
jgi:biopolymer transport protein ExbB